MNAHHLKAELVELDQKIRVGQMGRRAVSVDSFDDAQAILDSVDGLPVVTVSTKRVFVRRSDVEKYYEAKKAKQDAKEQEARQEKSDS